MDYAGNDYEVQGCSGRIYKQSALARAFRMVEDHQNWKNPIDALVGLGSDEQLIRDAVIHFTGSVPEIKRIRGGAIQVRAAGYYATIGA